jgi:sugar lactone lactonase YvrE
LGIVVDGSGNVYIADSGNRRIEKFSADGTFLGQWGPLLSGYGRLFLPSALAADSAGNIYIGDESTVIKVAPTGKVLQTILLPMQGTGSRGVTAGIALDPQGDIFVTDMQNSRIVKFAPGGQVLAVWS